MIFKKSSLPHPRQNLGFSLVIVLAAVALLVILMVAFLSSVSTDLQSSKVYSSGSALRLLSESAANLAIGQIRVATSDASLCWASQPGMIRTFNDQGQPAGYYKLYSDSGMQGTGGFDPASGTNAVPTNWYSQKGVYVDLNQPVSIGSTNYFPILDGDAADLASFTPGMEGTSVKGIGPLKGTQPTVEGFWLRSNTPLDASSPNQAPMPVKWLYVLQNGQVIVPTSGNSSGVISFDPNGAQPGAGNRIVGRVAFWTDDETCKVNINTASEGAFWDTPRTYSNQDYYLAFRQPVQGEFQRYPGHPATVCLSSVLGITGTAQWLPDAAISRDDIYPLTPATKPGGSQGGTVDSNGKIANSALALTQSVNRLYTSVDEFVFSSSLSGTNRVENSTLLASGTAINADALKRSRFFLTASSQAPDVNVFNLPRVSMWPITWKNGAPMLTPYDKLISFCSTINGSKYYFQRENPNHPTDDLPLTATGDMARNRQVLEYLRKLTSKAVPGFGSNSFASKYSDDRDQILVEMFDYVRATNLQESSFGTKNATTGVTPYAYAQPFDSVASSSSFKGGMGQVVPIVDQAVTVTDSVPGGDGSSAHPRGFGRFPTVHQLAMVFIGAGDNAIHSGTDNPYVPAVPGQGSGTPDFTAPGFSSTFTSLTGTSSTPTKQRVQAALLLQTFDPSQGVAATYPWYEVEFQNVSFNWSNASSGSYSMGFPTSGSLGKPYARNLSGAQQMYYGGVNDFRIYGYQKGAPSKYPFVTSPTGAVTSGSPVCPDMDNGGLIYFLGGSCTVNIYAIDQNGVRTPSSPVQSANFTFPPANIPVPITIPNSTATEVYPTGSYPVTYVAGGAAINFRSFFDSGSGASAIPGRLSMSTILSGVGSHDRVRALVATPGDMRLIAARKTVPSNFYQGLTAPGAKYSDSTVKLSHTLRFGLNYPVYGCAGGQLVYQDPTKPATRYSNWNSQFLVYGTNVEWNDFHFNGSNKSASSPGGSTYAQAKDVNVPSVAINSTTGGPPSLASGVPIDWDNGVANCSDGTFINKADEGDAGQSSGNSNPYYELDYNPNLTGPSFFSPARMIPSPGMFGSLPTGVWANKPFQTLLFRPGPANHPGLGSPAAATGTSKPPYTTLPDHLFMDLFNMPVVEPYAISTPLATAGRINMNHQIVPFTYIHRDTGLRAAMKAQMVTVIPPNATSKLYKTWQNPNGAPGSGNVPDPVQMRYPINAEATLAQFQARFDSGDIFRSASEICSIDIIPTGAPSVPSVINRSNMDAFWAANIYTGDNVKERPYTNLYPLLTTKSNTYTVHMRVQTLKQVPGGNYTTWREGKDQVTGQYRGSELVERYVDPKDTLPDYAVDPSNSDTLSQHYKFRTLANRQFAP